MAQDAGTRKPGADILHGSNRDDGDGFVHDVEPLAATCDEGQFRAYIGEVYSFDNATVDQVVALYSGSGFAREHPTLPGFSAWWWAADRVETDFAYACPARRASEWFAQDAGRSVYLYEWALHANSSFVAHGQEVPYVFDDLNAGAAGGDEAAARATAAMWAAFAKRGDPNGAVAKGRSGGDGAAWPRFEPGRVDPAVAGVGVARAAERGAAEVGGAGGSPGARAELFWDGPPPRVPDLVVTDVLRDNARCDFWDRWWTKRFNRCVAPVPKAAGDGRDKHDVDPGGRPSVRGGRSGRAGA
jgi:hypothetical protein